MAEKKSINKIEYAIQRLRQIAIEKKEALGDAYDRTIFLQNFLKENPKVKIRALDFLNDYKRNGDSSQSTLIRLLGCQEKYEEGIKKQRAAHYNIDKKEKELMDKIIFAEDEENFGKILKEMSNF